MSCEIRSMMTSYFFGSSIRMPPIFTNSAVTPSTFIELIFSTNAGGNVFSIPKRIPIFLSAISQILFQNLEGGAPSRLRRAPGLDGRDARLHTRNTFPPSAATPANHACCYPRRYPTNAESSCPEKSQPSLRSRRGTYPNPLFPGQSLCAANGSAATRHSCSSNSQEDC